MLTYLAALVMAPLDGLPVGEVATFTARSLEGKEIVSASLTTKPTVILLWGPWSAGSSRALTDMSKLADQDRRATIVGLASWDDAENVRSFLNTLAGVNIEMWADPAGKDPSASIAVRTFRTKRFPSVYVLDRRQRVVGSFLSYRGTEDVRALITKAIGQGD